MKKIIITLLCLLLCGCNKEVKTVDLDSINNFNYDNIQQFDFDIHSKEYLLVRLSDFKVMYSKDEDKRIYPASLTKLLTLDTVLNKVSNLDETSSISSYQFWNLIEEDASVAFIQTDYDYSIRDLLHVLILPSGADGAVALENYFESHGMNLVEEMNKQAQNLGCSDSHFVNTTGLHDDNHYTTLNDLFKIVMDVLKFEDGRTILETLHYKTVDDIDLRSTLSYIKDDAAILLGGKTGYTTESGQSVVCLYRANNRSYIMLIANAMGNPNKEEYFHYDDAMEIMDKLY